MSTPAPPPVPPTVAAPMVADVEASRNISSTGISPPKYPPQEQRDGIGGQVKLLVTINAEGDVVDVVIEKSSRNRNLDRAAMDAVRKTKFRPGIKNGQKTGGSGYVLINFVPEQ
jgi:protein TonB